VLFPASLKRKKINKYKNPLVTYENARLGRKGRKVRKIDFGNSFLFARFFIRKLFPFIRIPADLSLANDVNRKIQSFFHKTLAGFIVFSYETVCIRCKGKKGRVYIVTMGDTFVLECLGVNLLGNSETQPFPVQGLFDAKVTQVCS
jgi:hypothetical protein